MKTDQLKEQLKTVTNLCLISLLLIDLKREELLPTVLELLYVETQQITEEHCVK